MTFDLLVVGAGIVGLAHALAAARSGRRVLVIDRDARANGASIRNFGFVTVTGQRAGQVHARALRSRDVWDEVAAATGLPVLHRGLLVAAHSPEAVAVLEAFADTDMGTDCELLAPAAALARCPQLAPEDLAAALWSPHERRVEPRQALPVLAQWLAEAHGVEFRFGTLVRSVERTGAAWRARTTAGDVEAGAALVCSGGDFQTLFPERLAAYGLTLCKLQMARTASQPMDWRLPCAVMSDSSLVRYDGYAMLPESAALRRRLGGEIPDTLAAGVHLIVVQAADGSLVIGDSHDYGPTPDPFYRRDVEDLFLRELHRTLQVPERAIAERWIGLYPSSPHHVAFVDAPADGLRIALVTSGTGMSTAFAIGEEVVAGLFG